MTIANARSSGDGSPPPIGLQLRNATIEDGSTVDVAIAGDRIASVEPAGSGERDGAVEPIAEWGGSVDGGGSTVDLGGMLLVPAPAEPHAHLDKALTAERVPNPAGDLLGAIDAWLAHRPTIGRADYIERATAAALLGSANGCTAIRTHVDLGLDIGHAGLEALLQVKQDLADSIDIQLVGLLSGLSGVDGPKYLTLMREALDLGLDVVGGVPHIEDDPAVAIDLTLELAGEYDRPVDLHADENLDPASADLETLADRVITTGFGPPVVASHCVALAMKSSSDQGRIADLVAEAGIAVVALPQTNLYLQARGVTTAPPRGLTALAELQRAGVTVAAGGDNLRDPFCPVGRADPLEAASLLVMAGHQSPATAYRAVSEGARSAMGLEPATIRPGAP
ncbi:MAG: amidohydrolase family protein, partial [Acidimicrobiales bacterium]